MLVSIRSAVFVAGLMVASVAFAQPSTSNGEVLIAWRTLANRALKPEQAAGADRGFVPQFTARPMA